MRLFLLSICFLGVLSPAFAAKTGFQNRLFKNADSTESKYVLFVPHDYPQTGKPDKPYPVILFLHGAGESGSDGLKQSKTGLGPAIVKEEKTFPFIAIFPQASAKSVKGIGRWSAEAEDGKRAIAILDEIQKEFSVDEKRIYLTGLSMGGFGTWSIAAAYPQKWAAIVPICGGGNVKDAVKIKDIPCWCFHGDKDNAVPVARSREMIEALKKAGGMPKYTEYPGVGHNSWDKAYATKELYTWLLEQKLK